MDDQTIFQNPQSNQNNSSQSPPVEQVPTQIPSQESSVSTQQLAENTLTNPIIEDQAPPPSGFFSSFPLKTIIKAVIGLIVVIMILFVIFRVFFSSSDKPVKLENVTLTYWGLWEDEKVMDSIISDFQRENPNIKISYKQQTIKEYKDRLVTRIDNGSGPDIFRFHNTWLPQLSRVLLPLSADVITKDEFKNNYYPVTQADIVKNGAIYGIPLEIDTLSLFINTEDLQAAGINPPTTWPEFQNAANILTTTSSDGKIIKAGAAMGTVNNITHATDIISLLMIHNGANLRNPSSTLKNVADALDFYISFTKGENLNKVVWSKDQEESIIAFSKGNLSMYMGYSWDIFLIENYKRMYNSSVAYQIVPVPQIPPYDPADIASYWVEGVSSKSKHPKEALLFMKFLTKKETQEKLYTEVSKVRLFGEPYSRVDLADKLKGNEMVYPFVSQGKIAVSSYFASDTYDNGINEKMNDYLRKAVESISNDTSSETAADTLSKGVAQVLKEYGL